MVVRLPNRRSARIAHFGGSGARCRCWARIPTCSLVKSSRGTSSATLKGETSGRLIRSLGFVVPTRMKRSLSNPLCAGDLAQEAEERFGPYRIADGPNFVDGDNQAFLMGWSLPEDLLQEGSPAFLPRTQIGQRPRSLALEFVPDPRSQGVVPFVAVGLGNTFQAQWRGSGCWAGPAGTGEPDLFSPAAACNDCEMRATCATPLH